MRSVLSGAVFWLCFGLCVLLILPACLLLGCGLCLFNLGDGWSRHIKNGAFSKELF